MSAREYDRYTLHFDQWYSEPRPRSRLASFPGTPRVRTKNQKERGEPGKIYHVRNVIGRENLITYGQTNKFAHALLTEYTRSVAKALWLTEPD